jgi:putative transposase
MEGLREKSEVMETDKDHIHLLLDMEPTVAPVSIVNRLKSISTNRIWKRHEAYLKGHFWKERTFWSDGYFVCSTGNASMETIRAYIESQG